MLAVDALEILGQIQVLVVDKLQVVSYKWLSRNFSISSNQSKKLLQEFVNKHDTKVEVLYSLAGWSKSNSGTYFVKLASGQKLEEVRKEFDGNCSVEVYSIQSCLPKDLAVLWNAEFVQAEELFNQPSAVENSLRNNRFGGISNGFVKRAVNGQSAAVSSTSQLKDNVGIVQTKACNIPQDENLQPQQSKGGVKVEPKASNTAGSVDKADQIPGKYTTMFNPVKETANPVQTNRKSVLNEKTSSGPGGSLTTLWGRASVKSKPSGMASHSTNHSGNAALTADAKIHAEEAADAMSSDDEGYGVSYKRESNGSGTRKRQLIINYSDEEEEDDNVVSLASPIPPNENSFPDSLQNAENLSTKKELVSADKLKAKKLVNERANNEKSCELSSSEKNGIAEVSFPKNGIAEVSFPKAENNLHKDVASTNEKESGSMVSKRKKVVKKRIDERGREVMEVVWEDSVCSKHADKDNTNDAGNRPTAAIKEQATGTNAPTNTGTKGGTKKPGKAGANDTKQGKISSFFKKI